MDTTAANAGARPGDVPPGQALLRVAWLPVLLVVWVTVSESSFAFDKGETFWQYPEVTSFGPWRWIADLMSASGFGPAGFYRVVSLLFAVSYLCVARWITSNSIALGFGYAVLFLSWFGFGQLRYGTALNLLMIAIALRKEHSRLAVVIGGLGVLTHVAIAPGTALFVVWGRLTKRNSGWALAPVLLAYALLFLFGVGEITRVVLGMTGYANYLNWLSFDAPNTLYKYVYLIGVLLASWAISKRAYWRELTFALALLPSSLSPPLAGRGYFFIVAATLASLCARDEADQPPTWVKAMITFPLVIETIVLWRSDLFTF